MEEEHKQAPNLPPSGESERKLWLEYIRSLNDRHLRSRGISGATSWALLGVLAAILYRSIPHLPAFLADPNNLKNSWVLFVFEFDMAFHLKNPLEGYRRLTFMWL
jgi:hypothetical protein